MASKPHMLKKYKTLLTISIIVMVVGALLSLKILKSRSKISGNITQTATEGLLPATVFFDMRLPYSSDSLFVNFGDKSPLVYVKQRQQKTAHNYLFPGVFDVNLQTRLNTVASTKVYVRSNKWIGLGYHRQRDLPDRYYAFPALKTGSDSLFHIPNNQLFKMGLDTAGSFFTRLCNFTPTGYASDNFVFETSFKNDLHEKGMYCHSTQFQISGMNSMIRFKLVSPGCSSQVLNVVSEQSFEGSTSNLSQFVVDLENWNTIELINQNKHLTLLVNGKRVFEGSYQKSLGEIKGLFLEFEGNGFVKNCNLKSYDGETLYHF